MKKEPTLSQAPPNDPDAEVLVIGAVLNKDTGKIALDIVLPIIQSNDFYSQTRAEIFNIILRLYDKKDPIDQSVIESMLEDTKLLDELRYCCDIADTQPPTNVKYWADLIKSLSIRRKMIHDLYNVYQKTSNTMISLEEIKDEIDILDSFIPENNQNQRRPIENALEFLKREKTKTPYIIDQLVPESGFSTIAGYTGQGKSTLATQLCLSILSGYSFLNQFVIADKIYHILYLNLENSDFTIDRILNSQLKEYEISSEKLERLFIPDCLGMSFDDRYDLKTICRWIDELHIELIVVDPILDSFIGDQNDLTIVRALIKKMRNIGSHLSWVLIHHFKKGDDEDDIIKLMLGSVGFSNAMTSIIGLRRYAKNTNPSYKKIEFGKIRDYETPEPIKVMMKRETRIFEVVADSDNINPISEEIVVQILKDKGELTYTNLVTLIEFELGISDRHAKTLVRRALGMHKIKASNGLYLLTNRIFDSYLEMTKSKT